MARTNLDGLFFMDSRFEYLGELTSRGEFDARGRILRLWQICIDRLEDVMSAKEIGIQAKVGPNGGEEYAEHMVEALLAEKLGDDTYRIRGVRQRSEWLANAKERGKKGGRPKRTPPRKPLGEVSKTGKPEKNCVETYYETENLDETYDEPEKTSDETGKPVSETENLGFELKTSGFVPETTALKPETPRNLIYMDMDIDTDIDTDKDIYILEKTKNPEQFVEVLISDAINARHDCLEENQARERIDPLGWALLLRQFSTWDRFCESYARSYKTGFEPKFKKDLTLSLLGRIEQTPGGRGSGVQLVSGASP